MDKKKYEKYEKLLLQRDELLHKAGAYLTSYFKEFGEEIAAVFEKKIECIRKKKSIAFCQMKLNRGEEVDSEELDAYISETMEEYEQQLVQLVTSRDMAAMAEGCSEADILKAKRIYRNIAKLIHPDICPELFENEKIREMWEQVCEAYGKNDGAELERLEFLICSMLDEMGIGNGIPEIEDIDDKINAVEIEIEQIITTDPYCYGELLEDRELVRERHLELERDLEEYTEYSEELELVLMELLGTGVTISWEMKL